MTIAFVELQPGMVVAVSDGAREPLPKSAANRAWREWKSHNLIGTVSSKSETSLELQDTIGVKWTISAVGHTFRLTNPTVSQLQADLIAKTKTVAERLSMQMMTTGGSKKKKYASKEREVANWYALGAVGAATNVLLSAFNLLPADVKTRQFRYAQAEVAKRGGTVADAIARFKAGMDVSEAECARLEAIEQDAVARIKAASTAAAKQQAFDSTDWAVSLDRMEQAMLSSGF